MTTDLLVRGATVIDGSGVVGVVADVAVSAGRIVAVGADAAGGARRTIEAAGLVLCPGFVDMHAHSDLQILVNPDHTAKVSQGVTTEVLGQDGLSFAPIDEPTLGAVRRQIVGWNGEPDDFDFSWRSVEGYLDRLDVGIACHAAYLVPQGTLRMMVVGHDDRPATAAELDRMRVLLADGLRQGALGMSSGLTYPPGMFADTAELVELCAVVARFGGYHSPHTRSYGRGAIEAYAEMVEVSRRTGCPLHLTHATMNFEPNRGRAGELLALVDAALAEGLDLTLDTYPYLPGATSLSAVLPSWAATRGPESFLASLDDPEVRARLRHELEEVGTDGCHGCVVDWDTLQISGVRSAALEGYVGRRVDEIARSEGLPPSEVFFRILREDNMATTILQHVGDEENVRAIMGHPAHCGGSDGILVGGRPHPRSWGTFPRYLARYARELGVLSLPECVHHLTERPARRLRLLERGLVRQGFHADLVLFDPERVRDAATFEQPRTQAEGIPWVLVDGTPVIEEGHRTEALPGRALRRTDEGALHR